METLLQEKLLSVGSWSLTVAMVTGLLITWILTELLVAALRKGIHRQSRLLNLPDTGRRHSLYLIAKYIIWTISAGVMLEIVGIHVTVLLAGSAALLVGLGLGIQQIFRDIVSGIFLLFEGTIEIGDILQLDNTVAEVAEINLRTSRLITKDGKTLMVPNHKFITENLVNWSHGNKQPTRFTMTAETSLQVDAGKALNDLLSFAASHPDILKDAPEHQPRARLREMTHEKLTFDLHFWTYHKMEADRIAADIRILFRESIGR
ncbi:MAG: mechanosensitive ion channel family protein [Bacteroidota bacterium]